MAEQPATRTAAGGGSMAWAAPPASTDATAPEDDAQQTTAQQDEAVHYYFPVEIEVRGASADVNVDAVVAEALRRLTEGIRSA
jgi:hypothetical protein